ncbi:MAG TPA: beta-L-arabinofuranosidase domain-containing protein [Bacteroidales bacterium]|nr:beta-L-arabinofuranosidase domain-containing protein [Bacteroidales bacterium]
MNKRKLRIIPLLILGGTLIAGVFQTNLPIRIKEHSMPNIEDEKNMSIKTYKYEIMPAGNIKPKGWIKQQLSNDLNEGYIGSFDKVHPTVTHNVFVKQNRLSKRRFSMRKEWWSGEHEGYWKDAVTRMAYLTNDQKYKEMVEGWIESLISADETGYIGIYSDKDVKGSRFNHSRENGELWVTSRILMAVLAYYEFTGDQKALDAAEEAVQLIMHNYKTKNYFRAKSRGGGVSHGIGFFENLEWLYRITRKQMYIDFAKKLYKDFNEVEMRDDDLQTKNLLEEKAKFDDHGAHIAEGLFIPRMMATFDSSIQYQNAADKVLSILDYHTTPSGAMRSDEWVKERKGTADERYEYCGIAEMISPLNKMISFTGNLKIANRIEKMTYNAGQGARFPILKALSYFSKDNRIKINHREIAKREAYNAVHFAASCCVLNGARLMPYYVEGMWMAMPEENGLAAILYGPSEIETIIQGTKVHIEEKTNYPFSDNVAFNINPVKPTEFIIELRKPFGCNDIEIEIPDGAEKQIKPESIIIKNTWQKGDQIRVRFNFEIQTIPQPESVSVQEKGVYIQRGPLIYALPFEHEISRKKEHRNSGFYSYRLKAKDKTGWKYTIDPKDSLEFNTLKNRNLNNPWDGPVQYIEVELINGNNEKIPKKLVPMGNTVFRRVTFPVNTKQ